MKKLLKVIGIILLIIVIIFVLLIVVAVIKENNYYKYTTTEGELEKKYSALGEYDVSYKEYDASDNVALKYAIYYPSELEEKNNKYSVVVWANGTGFTSDSYKSFLKHLSSWGFIVVGNDDQNTRTGESLEETIKFLIEENNNKDSIFYQKIDLDNIGLGGHSQGGVAVYNMVTKQEHGSMIKVIFTASATSSYHTSIMQDNWEYDISKVNVPTFMIAGTGLWDSGSCNSKDEIPTDENGLAQGICPVWSLQENYDLLSNDIDKIIARKINVDHGESYKQVDGYMTAWFRYYLQSDNEAGKVFIGNDAEISNNSLYQDIQKNF